MASVPPDSPPPTSRWWQILLVGRHPRLTLARLLLLVGLSYGTFGHVLLPVRVTGISMEPTYRDGSVNCVNRLSFRFRPPAPGDIVAIRSPGLRPLLLKRILAGPGDRIRLVRGQVFVNDQPLDEPYLDRRRMAPWNEAETRLGVDEYYVVGDNRTMAGRDHVHGVTSGEYLVGRVLW
ncbi:MAG: signal peptidase I [Verrucomicrobiota bacterium]